MFKKNYKLLLLLLFLLFLSKNEIYVFCCDQDGYYVGVDPCTDYNECVTSELPFNGACSQICVNTIGSYYCTCYTGYTLTTQTSKMCTLLDCLYDKNNNCDVDQYPDELWNTGAGYYKKCRNSVDISKGSSCQDIDECATNNGGCQSGCVNTNGGFYCTCPAGYQLVGDTTCQDMDECANNNGGCQSGCVNTNGGFYCTCPAGYQLVGDTTCQDVDECQNDAWNNCAQKCINLPGGYSCDCSTGYKLNPNGHDCDDLCDIGMVVSNVNNSNDTFQCSFPNFTISSVVPTSTYGGEAIFYGDFGIFHNNITLLIGGVNCPISFNSSDQINCICAPGTGIHSVKLTQNNITFIGKSIYHYQQNSFSCPKDCSNHGACNSLTGDCICDKGFQLFDCSGATPNNQTNNGVEITDGSTTITHGGQDNINFQIYYKSLNEIDFNGNIIKSIPLQNKWVLNKTINNQNIFIQELNQTIDNKKCILTSIIEEMDKDKQFNFANIEFNLKKGDIKFTIYINNYKFSSFLNTLQLVMISTVNENDDTNNGGKNNNCNLAETEINSYNNGNSKFNYIKIKKDDKVFSGRFLNQLLVDNRPTFFSSLIKNESSNSISVTLLLPFFKNEVVIDPDFSVLLSGDSKPCQEKENSERKWFLPVVIAVPIVGVSLLVIGGSILYKKNLMLRIGVKKLKNLKNIKTKKNQLEMN